MDKGLSEKESQTLIQLLNKWEGGPLSPELFDALGRIIPQVAIEMNVVREGTNGPELVLIYRDEHDIHWPGMLHQPGTILRNSDFIGEPIDPRASAYKRLLQNEIRHELMNVQDLGTIYRVLARGAEIVHVFYAELKNNDPLHEGQEWHSFHSLKHNAKYIQGLHSCAERAIEHFQSK